MSIAGNERADEAAEAALKLDSPGKPAATASYLARAMKEHVKKKWQELIKIDNPHATGFCGSHFRKMGGGIAKLQKPIQGKRNITTAFYQLLMGKGCHLSALFKAKKVDSQVCRHCGEENESVEHVTLHCPAFLSQQNDLRLDLGEPPTMPKLFFSDKGKAAMLKFIKNTGFGTYKWSPTSNVVLPNTPPTSSATQNSSVQSPAAGEHPPATRL